MGFLSKFEGKMEDTLEGAADHMVKSPISPVQIAKKAEKKMRREKMVGAGKQYAPTLYTVLVNADDDERLFGYYPTLAGETETYLAAKAAEEGLVMDGQPLVRFIVDEGLRHGKFDVIAEAVAAPLIAQLRQEEMERYGLAGAPSAARGGGAPYGAPAGYGAPAAAGYGAPAAAGYAPAAPYDAGADLYGNGAAPYDPYAASDPYAANDRYDPYAPAAEAAPYGSPAAAPFGAGMADPYAAPVAQDAFGDAPSANGKPPLPYVPEDEIDYSIDYGEYTFDSQNFEDYRDNGLAGAPLPNSGAYGSQQPGFAGAARQAPDACSARGAGRPGRRNGRRRRSRRSSCGSRRGCRRRHGCSRSRRCAQHRRVRCRRRRRHAAAFGRRRACAPGRHHQQPHVRAGHRPARHRPRILLRHHAARHQRVARACRAALRAARSLVPHRPGAPRTARS